MNLDLWIRSQDKQILTKVDSLILTNTGDIKLGNDIDTGITLASYCPNYQRALEVLDEIQSILNLKDMYKYDRELVLKSWENVDEEQVKIVRQQMSVYEMPEK